MNELDAHRRGKSRKTGMGPFYVPRALGEETQALPVVHRAHPAQRALSVDAHYEMARVVTEGTPDKNSSQMGVQGGV